MIEAPSPSCCAQPAARIGPHHSLSLSLSLIYFCTAYFAARSEDRAVKLSTLRVLAALARLAENLSLFVATGSIVFIVRALNLN